MISRCEVTFSYCAFYTYLEYLVNCQFSMKSFKFKPTTKMWDIYNTQNCQIALGYNSIDVYNVLIWIKLSKLCANSDI